MRLCPYCDQEIEETAKQCKYCFRHITPLSEDDPEQENFIAITIKIIVWICVLAVIINLFILIF